MAQKIGIVVGRFQVPDLHDGHLALLRFATKNNDQLLIIVGNGVTRTARNPLPFADRKRMLLDAFPDACIVELSDQRSDEKWSAALDELVSEKFPHGKYTLYGSRQSFREYYSGAIPFQYVPEVPSFSGTDARRYVCREESSSSAVRRGIIRARSDVYPTSFQTVDVAVVDYYQKRILLGRKADECGWRFPGGFVDPTDPSLEAAAKRELVEEVGLIEVADATYLGSFRINDWRYRGERDQIMTAFFSFTYVFGSTIASDDLAETKWFSYSDVVSAILPEHLKLAERLLQHLEKGA